MTRSDVACAAIALGCLAFVVALCWWTVSLSLACGDRGGDIYWGAWLRHVCIGPDGQVLP